MYLTPFSQWEKNRIKQQIKMYMFSVPLKKLYFEGETINFEHIMTYMSYFLVSKGGGTFFKEGTTIGDNTIFSI